MYKHGGRLGSTQRVPSPVVSHSSLLSTGYKNPSGQDLCLISINHRLHLWGYINIISCSMQIGTTLPKPLQQLLNIRELSILSTTPLLQLDSACPPPVLQCVRSFPMCSQSPVLGQWNCTPNNPWDYFNMQYSETDIILLTGCLQLTGRSQNISP